MPFVNLKSLTFGHRVQIKQLSGHLSHLSGSFGEIAQLPPSPETHPEYKLQEFAKIKKIAEDHGLQQEAITTAQHYGSDQRILDSDEYVIDIQDEDDNIIETVILTRDQFTAPARKCFECDLIDMSVP